MLGVKATGLAELRERLGRWNTATWAAAVGPLAGQALLDALRTTINRRTGQTAATLGYSTDGEHVQWAGNAVAGYLAFGTAPHPIYGNPYLAFPGRDGMVIRRMVNHPGTSPYDYRERAVALSEGSIVAAAREQALALLGVG